MAIGSIGRVGWLAVGLAWLAAAGAVAQTPEASIRWSTYLRAEAAQTSTALDELEHDTRVQLLGCSDRWCRITNGELSGYVDRDALDLPRPPQAGRSPPDMGSGSSPPAPSDGVTPTSPALPRR